MHTQDTFKHFFKKYLHKQVYIEELCTEKTKTVISDIGKRLSHNAKSLEKKNQHVGSFLHNPPILGKDMYFFPK